MGDSFKDLGKDDLIGEHPHMNIPERNDGNNPQTTVSESNTDGIDGASQSTNDTAPPATTTSDQTSAQNAPNSPDPTASKQKPTYDTSNDVENDNVKAEIASSERSQHSRVAGIANHLNAGAQDTTATAEDDDSMDDFNPHIMHKAHKTCPIAMVNRQPRGSKLFLSTSVDIMCLNLCCLYFSSWPW